MGLLCEGAFVCQVYTCIVDKSFRNAQVSDMAARVLGYVQQGYIVRARTDIDTIVRLCINTWAHHWEGWCTGTTVDSILLCDF